MTTVLIFVAIVVLVIVWTIASIKILGPTEMGVVSYFGKASYFVDSGWRFLAFPFGRLYKYPKGILRFEFQVQTATTRNGAIKGYNNDETVGAADLNIDCVLLTYFSPGPDLLKTLSLSPGNSPKDMGPIIVPYVIDVIRSVAGSLPWPLVDMEREKLLDYILSRIIPDRRPNYSLGPNAQGFYEFTLNNGAIPADLQLAEMEKENPLVQFGLDLSRTSLNVEDVNLADDELATLLSWPEKARLKGISTVKTATAKKKELMLEGEGKAYARRKMIDAIKQHPDLEFLFALREMAQGTSNTILYQIPAAFESRIKNILGGNDPKDFLKGLTEEDWVTFQGLIKSLKK